MTADRYEFIKAHAPCYLYDKAQIISRCRELRSAIPRAEFLYSVKANPFEPVLETVAGEGFGADAASSAEVLRARSAGIPRERVFYSAPGKTDADIERAWDKCTIIADSFTELARLERRCAARGVHLNVGVRVNPAFSGVQSKFGVDEEQLEAAELKYDHLTVTGFHVHLRSQVLDTDALCRYYENCFRMAERLGRKPGVALSFVNFGSGIGTVYDPARDAPVNLERMGRVFDALAAPGLRCCIETGRYAVCGAGKYYTRVVDRKTSRGRTYLIVQEGLNGFLRPALAELLRQELGAYPKAGLEPLYTGPAQCAFRVLGKTGVPETVDVVGSLCTALDTLARDIALPRAEAGDIIEVTNAGSYARSLSPVLFSSQDPPGEFLWEEP